MRAHVQAAGGAAARASDIPSQQRKLRKVQHRCIPLRWRSESTERAVWSVAIKSRHQRDRVARACVKRSI